MVARRSGYDGDSVYVTASTLIDCVFDAGVLRKKNMLYALIANVVPASHTRHGTPGFYRTTSTRCDRCGAATDFED